MDKIELLAPAGNKESLYMAVHAGADAVYLSGKNYGARKFADNFNDEEIVEAINYCHKYCVKVYVTLNTLIFESEVEGFINYAKFLYINNVDAVIVQDIGMINLLRKTIPDLEIHTSTQTHNYNINTTKMFKEMGIKRVVLARELTLEEIKAHSEIMDTEVFVHGAICMCYSGCCYMSLLRGGRSGNRGECAGSCRLPYKVNGKTEYALSTKDLCNIEDIDKIIESGTKSLKIEGRMKSKEYVYLVTKLYRKVIDKYYDSKKIEIDTNTYHDIQRVFNRDYTKGHKFNASDVMNKKRPNHQGINIGQAIKVDDKWITIKLEDNLIIGDGIKFVVEDNGLTITNIFKNEKKIDKATKGEVIKIKNSIGLTKKSQVVKTTDKLLIDSLKNIEEKRIKINCNVKIEYPFITIEYDDGNVESITKEIVQKSRSIITTNEEIKKQMSKLGNTPYKIDKINIESDKKEIFINIKDLNDIRRQIIDKLIDKRVNYNRTLNKLEYNPIINMNNDKIEISVSITNENQYEKLRQLKVDNIYTNNIELYNKHKNENIYYIMPRIIEKGNDDISNIVINDFSFIPSKGNIVSNYYMNITNKYSVDFLIKRGIKKICVSPDLNFDNLKDIATNNNVNFEVQVYGYLEAMITKNKIKGITELKSANYKYRIIDNNNYMTILTETINKITSMNEYNRINIKNYRIDFLDESPEEMEKIIMQVKKEILRF